MNICSKIFSLPIEPNHLFLTITESKEKRGLTELIAQLALGGPFYFIAGGEWVPDQDDLRTSIRRHTTDVDRILDNPLLTRPTTCLQFLDLIADVQYNNEPLLILDFLHLFYNVDIDISRRMRMIGQCCEHLQKIKQSRPVVVFMRQMPRDEYDLFFPIVASIANETVKLERDLLLQALLPEAFMGKDLKSSRALAEKLMAKLNSVGAVIQPNDRLIIKQFNEWILKHSVAISNGTDLSPMEAALAMIAVEEHKRINRFINDIEGWVRELEKMNQGPTPENE